MENPEEPPQAPRSPDKPAPAIRIDHLTLVELALDDINADDQTFALTRAPRAPDPNLTDSLRGVGFVAAPIVAGERRVIVSGRRRLAAWRALGHERATVRLAPRSATDADLLALAVDERRARRGLTTLERAMALRKLEGFTPRRLTHEAPEDAAWRERLGLGDSLRALDHLRQFADMPEAVLELLAEGALPEAAVPWLAEFEDVSDREALARWVARRGLTAGESRGALREILEIRVRDRVAPVDVLADLDGAVAGSRCAEKSAALDALRRRRHPVLTRVEEDWRRRHDALGLPRGCRIAPPRDFEGDDFRFEARIGGAEDLRRLVRRLNDLLDKRPEQVRELLEPEAEA